jgi:hypothetical protein
MGTERMVTCSQAASRSTRTGGCSPAGSVASPVISAGSPGHHPRHRSPGCASPDTSCHVLRAEPEHHRRHPSLTGRRGSADLSRKHAANGSTAE